MRIAITGGTGFIGRHLAASLMKAGHEVAVVSRSASKGLPGAVTLTWSQLEAAGPAREGWDAIVNLAGESINQRWTADAKKRILESRLEAVERVRRWVGSMERKPEVVVNGSGMNIYGYSESGRFTERSPTVQSDFLSGVVTEWERAADAIEGVRLVKVRTGLVLGRDGGALPSMALPYKLWAGGRVGSGRQWVSWIQLQDMVRVIEYAILHRELAGPVNATAPGAVTNDTFGRTLGRVLHRPHWMPVPGFALKLLFGELSDLLLKGQQVVPEKLLQSGFRFEYPVLEQALQETYKKR